MATRSMSIFLIVLCTTPLLSRADEPERLVPIPETTLPVEALASIPPYPTVGGTCICEQAVAFIPPGSMTYAYWRCLRHQCFPPVGAADTCEGCTSTGQIVTEIHTITGVPTGSCNSSCDGPGCRCMGYGAPHLAESLPSGRLEGDLPDRATLEVFGFPHGPNSHNPHIEKDPRLMRRVFLNVESAAGDTVCLDLFVSDVRWADKSKNLDLGLGTQVKCGGSMRPEGLQVCSILPVTDEPPPASQMPWWAGLDGFPSEVPAQVLRQERRGRVST